MQMRKVLSVAIVPITLSARLSGEQCIGSDQHGRTDNFALNQQLAGFIWNVVLQQRPALIEGRELGPVQLDSTVRAQVMSSDSNRLAAAEYFAFVMRGTAGVYSSREAAVAAELYAAAELPPGPASRVLQDRTLSPYSRLQALHALYPWHSREWFARALIASLCDVAAKVKGGEQMFQLPSVTHDVRRSFEAILTIDEQRFLLAAAQTLFRQSDPELFLRRVSDAFGHDDRILLFLQSYWSRSRPREP